MIEILLETSSWLTILVVKIRVDLVFKRLSVPLYLIFVCACILCACMCIHKCTYYAVIQKSIA